MNSGADSFRAPADWRRITTIDAHTAGEPLRVITSGFPLPEGDTLLAKRRYARENLDHLRRALVLEPRGHADMYACLLTPPVTADGHVGVLFLHNEGYSTMCGHGIIGLVKVGLEAGLFELDSGDSGDHARPEVRIDAPAGRITARAVLEAGRVRSVSFRNVPSFLLARDVQLDVPGLGRVTCDLGYGGAFYAYVDARGLDLEVTPANYAALIDAGRRIKLAVMASHDLRHPAGDADLNFLYGTILHQPGEGDVHSRNVCVFADGEVDRSPTGTGVSGRAAILHARGELELEQPIVIESLIGTPFTVRLVEETLCGELPAVIPEVTGTAHITGRHEFFLDPNDPLREGVLLR